MHVRRLPLTGPFQIFAACTERGDCPLEEFLGELDANLQKNADAAWALLQRVAEHGPPRNTELCHQLQDEIWEFIKGRIRILYFRDHGRIIVCTHGIIKRSRKIKRSDLERAEAVRRRYVDAKERDDIIIGDEHE